MDGQLPIGATHPDLGSNKSADGIIAYGQLGEDMSFGHLLCQKSDGKYYMAIANSDDTMPVRAMALWTEKAGKVCPILIQGYVRNDSWTFALSNNLYIDSSVSGLITTTQPTDYNQIVGNVIRPNIIYFNPEPNYDYGYDTRTTIKDLTKDVNALYERQTFSISLPIWEAGQFILMRGGKHPRLNILDAWVVVGDDSGLEQNVEMVGFGSVNILGTYDAGVTIPLEMERGNLSFLEDVIVRTTTNRRVTVELLCESGE